MPFTFSHPAIVLPLTYLPRKWYSLTGLITGSVIPDFEYFIRMKVQSNYSHTIGGLFWFDLPLGVFFAFLFHDLVRNSLFENLPTILKSRFARFEHFDWNEYFESNWLIVTISILIGAASHLLWDSFTHSTGYFVNTFPELRNTVNFIKIQIPVYKFLQHLSTLTGGLVVILIIRKLRVDKRVKGKFNLKYWGVLIGLTFTVIILRLLSGLSYKQYASLIVSAISAALIALILTAQLIKGRDKKLL